MSPVDNPVHKLARTALILLAAARATRFFTSDTLGEWVIVGPAKAWAWRREHSVIDAVDAEDHRDNGIAVPTPPPSGWRSRLVSGFDCPFCVGFWAGALILLGDATLSRTPLRPVWRLGLAALGLNYLAGHISARIDG